ncbi:MAG: nucleotidyltransferase domain-containing protein [Methylovulum sp.]|nr:nucleotidyltransferase domain-containing protein [Methylovulum sp.]
MDKSNGKPDLIQQARKKKKAHIMAYLNEAFKGFDCLVYLFGSYATGTFHGNSDVDILIIAPERLKNKHYREACDRMSALGMNYDILVADSLARLDESIASSLKNIVPLSSPKQSS